MDRSQWKFPCKVDSDLFFNGRRFSVLRNNIIKFQNWKLRERAKVVNYVNKVVDKNASKMSENIDPLIESGQEKGFEKKEYVQPGLYEEKFHQNSPGTDASFNINPVLVRDIYSYMRVATIELGALFWKPSFEICKRGQKFLIEWFVCMTSIKFNAETTHLAMCFFKEYLCEEESGKDLALVGTSAIVLACMLLHVNKMEEADDNVPDIVLKIRSWKQREKAKNVNYEGGDKNGSKTSANVDSLIESGHEKEFEKQEYLKPALYGEKMHSDFTGKDVNSNINPVLVRDIYIHMKEAESELHPLFRKPSFKICIKRRKSFINWFVYTTECLKMNTETLHLAVRYFDEYLCKEDIGEKDLVLVGTSAVFLACKCEEARDDIPDIDKLVQHAGNVYTKNEILNMEQKMLKALDFKLSYPTSYQFLQIYCHIGNIKGEVSFLAHYLCDVALMYQEIYYPFEPSRIAAATLALSNFLLYKQSRFNDIEVLTGYNQRDLKITGPLLFAKFDEIQITPDLAVKAKYSTLEYNNVSMKDYPRFDLRSRTKQ